MSIKMTNNCSDSKVTDVVSILQYTVIKCMNIIFIMSKQTNFVLHSHHKRLNAK